MNTYDAEELIVRLTKATLQKAPADKLLADETWLEERIIDVIEAVNADNAEEGSCATFSHEFCHNLMKQFPRDIRPGFDLAELDVDSEEDSDDSPAEKRA